MAYIFANCIPASELLEINSVVYLPDVIDARIYSSDLLMYGDSIFTLYRAGVLAGNDKIGTFYPHINITRAEAAAIICRLVLPLERVELVLSQVVIGYDYFTDELLSNYDSFEEFIQDEEYDRVLLITTNMVVKDFKWTYVQIGFEDDEFTYTIKEVYYTLDELTPEIPLVITGPIGAGTFGMMGMSFVDERNITRHFYIQVSGYDGSLFLREFE
jgi:hypothetical protein